MRHSYLSWRAIRAVLRSLLQIFFGRRGHRLVRGMRLFYRLRTLAVLGAGSLGGLTRRRSVRGFAGGDGAFRRIEKRIRKARHSVVVQMFIWKDDVTGRRMASVLLDAADRGVQVVVTKDAVGDLFEFERDFVATQHAPNPVWKRFWSHPNIRVSNRNDGDHAKVYVIDDDILLVTGMNIGDEYRYLWRDYLVELKGKRFVRQYLAHEPCPPGGDVRLVVNDSARREIRPCLMDMLSRATESIVLEQAYVSDAAVLSLLAEKTKAGVTVTLILPEHPDVHHYANMDAVQRLRAESDGRRLRVLLYPTMIHGKVVVVDKREAFAGSANLFADSLDRMGEVNVFIRGRRHPAVRRLREYLRDDAAKSRLLKGAPGRYWITRWLAWLGL